MSVEINATNFPDELFRQYISETLDINNDGILSDEEIANVTDIFLEKGKDPDILSLEGLQYFTALQSLGLTYYSNLTSINLSGLTSLHYLFISSCSSLVSLDLTSNVNLHSLFLGVSSITTLDLSANTELTTLELASFNSITRLDITNNTKLTSLILDRCNNLETLVGIENASDLSTCKIIQTKIHSLDLSSNNKLKKVVYVSEDGVDSSVEYTLLLGNQPLLTYLNVGASGLTLAHMNIAYLDLTQCPKLEQLTIEFTKLDSINISNCPNIYYLNARNSNMENRLLYIDISHCPTLMTLYRTITGATHTDGIGSYIEHKGTIDSKNALLKYANSTKISTDGIIPITITAQPENATISLGEQVSFNVIAIGENLSYRWDVKHGQNGEWSVASGGNSSTYQFTPTANDNDTYYRCYIFNEDTDIYSSIAKLTVNYIPVITQQPSDVTVYSGQEATFSIKADGEGLSYQWLYGSPNTPDLYWAEIANATEATLTLIASSSINDVCYRCKVQNEIGEVLSNYGQLHVEIDDRISKPIIVTHPQSATVNENESVTFSCEASGKDLAYQWVVRTYDADGVWSDMEIYGATDSSYTTIASMALNGQNFACIVSNAAGSTTTNSASLAVNKGQSISVPRITNQPTSVTVKSGSRAGFRVSADGGSLIYQWQVKRNGTWYDVTGETQSVYNFTAQREDNGLQYRCQIGNAAGTIYSSVVTLTIDDSSSDLPIYGYHSIIISGKNTYGEWEMYPTSRPHVALPEVKTNYVDLPGANGGIDYTELLIGEPTYGYRKGSWEFMLIPQQRWPDVFRSLASYLHGKIHTVVLEDDLNYEYTGRLSVNKWESLQHNSTIVIDYILEPVARNRSGETFDTDESDLQAATRLLRKSENSGKAIVLWNNYATIMPISEYFDDGDDISY